MEICKAPTLRLKALNKHTHIMYIEMENVIPKIKYVYIDKRSSITKHTKGSKECYLLGQYITCKFSRQSPLSSYKTTFKQQLNDEKR